MVGLSRRFKFEIMELFTQLCGKRLRLKKNEYFFQFEFPHIKSMNISAILSHLLVVVRLAGRASLIVLVHLLMNVTLMVILVL